MASLRENCVLLTCPEVHFVLHGEVILVARWNNSSRFLGRLPGHIQKHAPPAAAKGFLLSWLSGDRRVIMLGTGLAGKENQLLRADTLRIDIDKELKSEPFKFAQTEVSHFNLTGLVSRYGD
jgi:hypothetical protein